MLIDTNVWSELARRRPNRRVTDWLRAHFDSTVFSTLVEAEMWRGIALAADDHSARRLTVHLTELSERMRDRILPFDSRCARAWGVLVARLQLAGRTVGDLDTLIAAQALAYGMPVVTRNVKHFERTGVTLINPWEG